MSKLEQRTIRGTAVVLSLVIHLIALTAISLPKVIAAPSEPDYVELTRLDEPDQPQLPKTTEPALQTIPAIIKAPPPVPAKPEEKKKYVALVMMPEEQIVDLGRPQPGDEKPDHYRFRSQRDMKVDQETIKRSESRTGSPGDTPGRKPAEIKKPDTREDVTSPQRVRSKAATTRRPATPKPGIRAKSPPESKAPPSTIPGENGAFRLPRKPSEDKVEVEIAKRGAEGVEGEDLAVTLGDARKTYESDNGSIERLPPDVRNGRVTALNAREYTHASFYNRINKVIKFYWEPWGVLEHMNWNGRTLVTQLLIVTDAEGNILSVEVSKSCGYPRVDAEAVKAVRQAAPFYNIPQALLDEQGHFVYNLGFYISSN